jgi:membrane protein DedA with SNARE-associated domain/rhodanese-related sulfurtransferase
MQAHRNGRCGIEVFVEQVQAALSSHGIWVVLGLVLASGAGLPLPAPPVLLAAGVLAGAGRLSLAAVLAGSLLALLATDLLWYQLGRWRGRSILGLLCRISLEPDSCVQRTEDLFSRYRGGALLISKFLPGLKTAAPPLAGLIEMPLGEFVLYTGAGSLLWAAAFVLPGYLFSERIARVAPVGGWVAAAGSLAFAAWLGWKILQRRRTLQIGRVTPDELFAQQESGRAVLVVDLRHPNAVDSKVRGALQMTPEELRSREADLPRDRDVVLYCGCPNEGAAAQMALLLRARGFRSARPLLGGIDAWRARGYPVDPPSELAIEKSASLSF